MKTLPTLYKLTATGAIQQWSIGVDDNVIIVNYGQKGGKIARTEETIAKGKNIGRANETTPAQQALAEATARWEGKVKKGYVEALKRAKKGEKDIEGGYDCLLAHKYSDHGHKIVFPAYVQPKLNGHRCLAVIKDGEATLWSRTRKPITSCPHIVEELQLLYPDGYHEVDGELYNHECRDRFEDLASLIRQTEPAENHTDLQYHIYDRPGSESFANRTAMLLLEFRSHQEDESDFEYLKLVHTRLVDDEESLIDCFEHFRLDLGYEGAMVRNAHGKYIGRRSYDLQKIKEFQDDDYPIVRIKEGRGTYAGCGLFICVTPEGKEFEAKMRGPKDQLREFLNHPKLWQGKSLVVKYQYISKYGIPIFPVGERFSDK